MRRPVFTIHPDHSVEISIRKTRCSPSDGSVEFSTETELGRLAAEWPAKRLVEIWNRLPNVNAVARFTDRRTAVRRIWAKIQELEPREKRLTPVPVTKAERVVALLKDPSGASLRAIMDLTGWQPHSVRGFISAQLSKRMGLKIQSFKRRGERYYRILP
jgi:uncharacterized protein DUF3489